MFVHQLIALYLVALVTMCRGVAAFPGTEWMGSYVVWIVVAVIILIVVIVVFFCLWYYGYFNQGLKGSVKGGQSKGNMSGRYKKVRPAAAAVTGEAPLSKDATISATSTTTTSSSSSVTNTLSPPNVPPPNDGMVINMYDSVPEEAMAPKNNVLYQQIRGGAVVGLRPVPLEGPFGLAKLSRNLVQTKDGQIGQGDGEDEEQDGAQPKSPYLNADMTSNLFRGPKH